MVENSLEITFVSFKLLCIPCFYILITAHSYNNYNSFFSSSCGAYCHTYCHSRNEFHYLQGKVGTTVLLFKLCLKLRNVLLFIIFPYKIKSPYAPWGGIWKQNLTNNLNEEDNCHFFEIGIFNH